MARYSLSVFHPPRMNSDKPHRYRHTWKGTKKNRAESVPANANNMR